MKLLDLKGDFSFAVASAIADPLTRHSCFNLRRGRAVASEGPQKRSQLAKQNLFLMKEMRR